MYEGGLVDISYPKSNTRRGRVQGGGQLCPTLTTQGEIVRMMSEVEAYKLTPRESWRLMGFTDEDFDKAYEAMNGVEGKLYKQAGNSIVVNVLEAIFKQLIGD